jgi:hypothetical protein
MSKLFLNMPKEFEQFNPEDLLTKLNLTTGQSLDNKTTVDENGLLHSFDDLPSTVYHIVGSSYIFQWHEHGILSRSGNRPFHIQMSRDDYKTYDENYKIHSFNGAPGNITDGSVVKSNMSFKWYQHGKAHRDNDEPAEILIRNGFQRKVYYKADEIHRDFNKPAVTEENRQLWAVVNTLHNSQGSAKIKNFEDLSKKKSISNWYLYGIHLNEEAFCNIKTYQVKQNVPLWVAFLREVKLIDEISITSFTDELGNWNSSLPTSWLLQVFNITEEKWEMFAKKIYKVDTDANYPHDHKLEFKSTRFDQFLAVIKHEETHES